MKYALLSDIHGNDIALAAVLKKIKNQNIDKLLIAGDFVGYFYKPSEVLKLLKGFDILAVKGNHEIMYEKACVNNNYLQKVTNKYGFGIKYAIKEIKKQDKSWLKKLNKTKLFKDKDLKIMICHGSPWSHNKYIYPDVKKIELRKFLKYSADIFILGHTHYSLVKKISNKIIINPGSVGQSREKRGFAQWAVLDTKKNKLKFYKVKYNISKTIASIDKNDPCKNNLMKSLYHG